MIGESPTRPGYLNPHPLVVTADATLPFRSRATKFTVPRSFTISSTIGPSAPAVAMDAGVCFDPRRPRLRREKVALLGADLAGESRRTGPHEHHVRQSLHHRAGHRDRMQEAGERGDGAGRVRGAVDDRRVELDDAENVRQAAVADGVIRRIGLDDPRARFDGIERAAASGEDADARGERAPA